MFQELKCSNEKLCTLRDQHQQLLPRLQQADRLRTETRELSRRHQRLEELYQRERSTTRSLQAQSRQGWEWKAQCASLRREKEEGVRRVQALEQTLRVCQAQLKELEAEKGRKQQDLDNMKLQLEEERAHAMSKIKVRNGVEEGGREEGNGWEGGNGRGRGR